MSDSTFEDICCTSLSAPQRSFLDSLLSSYNLCLVAPSCKISPAVSDLINGPFLINRTSAISPDFVIHNMSFNPTSTISNSTITLADQLVQQANKTYTAHQSDRHSLTALPKRYKHQNSIEKSDLVMGVQSLSKKLCDTIQHAIRISSNLSTNANEKDNTATAQAQLMLSQSKAIERSAIICSISRQICELAQSLQYLSKEDMLDPPIIDLLLLSDEDALDIIRMLFEPDHTTTAFTTAFDPFIFVFRYVIRWLLFQRLAELDRPFGRTLASALRIVMKAQPKLAMKELIVDLLWDYSQRSATAMIESICKISKESLSQEDQLYLLCIIEENQERRLELNSLMIPLLDLLPLTSTSVVVSSKFIDVILAFLYRFQPDIRQSAVKFASAILGVCHAFEDMKLSFIQIKMLEQLAFGTNTFLRRKLVSSTSRLLANAI
ncbi:hypothetical protein QVD99_001776 [Batrachochytrium dendrobatidis]|nr:hypothetical protein O5D80_000419 [Batrachochytrium dendrobatidis]KAK5671951.1 hypothetical protein QVD99_001776 [Batrachochytrium dendrobatidis]